MKFPALFKNQPFFPLAIIPRRSMFLIDNDRSLLLLKRMLIEKKIRGTELLNEQEKTYFVDRRGITATHMDHEIFQQPKYQISGLISPNKSLKELFIKPFTPENKDEQLHIQKFFLIKACQALFIFHGKIQEESIFLSGIMNRFGRDNHLMPELLTKYFGPVALTQHFLTLWTCYSKYNKDIIYQLSDGLINMESLDSKIPLLNLIENGIYIANMGNALKNNPNAKVYAVNPQKLDALPDYDTEQAKKICEQPNIDHFTVIGLPIPIPSDLPALLLSFNLNKGECYRYQDEKSSGNHALTLCRTTLTQGFYELDKGQMLQFTNNYISALKAKINGLNLSKNEKKSHPYQKLLVKLELIKNNKTLEIPQVLKESMLLLQEAVLDPQLNALNISLTTDAGIDTEFIQFYEHHLKENIDTIQHKYLCYKTLFPTSSEPDLHAVKDEALKLIKLFPEEIQQSMWHNFERFGPGNENMITDK